MAHEAYGLLCSVWFTSQFHYNGCRRLHSWWQALRKKHPVNWPHYVYYLIRKRKWHIIVKTLATVCIIFWVDIYSGVDAIRCFSNYHILQLRFLANDLKTRGRYYLKYPILFPFKSVLWVNGIVLIFFSLLWACVMCGCVADMWKSEVKFLASVLSFYS